MRQRLLILIITALVGFTPGCGDDDEESSSPPNEGAAAPAAPAVDEGCTEEQPNRISIEPPESAALALFCASNDFTNVYMENSSKKVLGVWTPSDSAPTDLTVSPPSEQAFEDAAALEAVPGECDTNYANCVVPAAATLFATSDQPVRLRFQVLPEQTIRANAARGLAAWVVGKFRTPGRSMALRVQGCATSAAQLSDQSPYLEDALRTAVTTGSSCGSLVSDVLREQGLDPRGSRPQAIDEVMRTTRTLAGGTFTDELVAVAIKVLPRR